MSIVEEDCHNRFVANVSQANSSALACYQNFSQQRFRRRSCTISQIPTDLLRKIIDFLPGPCLFLCMQATRRFHESQDDVCFWTARLHSEFDALDYCPVVSERTVAASRRVYARMLMWKDAIDSFNLIKQLRMPSEIDSDVVIDGNRLDQLVLRALAFTTALTSPGAADLGALQLRKLRAASMLPLAVLVHSQRRDLRDSAAVALANVVACAVPLARRRR